MLAVVEGREVLLLEETLSVVAVVVDRVPEVVSGGRLVVGTGQLDVGTLLVDIAWGLFAAGGSGVKYITLSKLLESFAGQHT